jgi:hypothetical protein
MASSAQSKTTTADLRLKRKLRECGRGQAKNAARRQAHADHRAATAAATAKTGRQRAPRAPLDQSGARP